MIILMEYIVRYRSELVAELREDPAYTYYACMV